MAKQKDRRRPTLEWKTSKLNRRLQKELFAWRLDAGEHRRRHPTHSWLLNYHKEQTKGRIVQQNVAQPTQMKTTRRNKYGKMFFMMAPLWETSGNMSSKWISKTHLQIILQDPLTCPPDRTKGGLLNADEAINRLRWWSTGESWLSWFSSHLLHHAVNWLFVFIETGMEANAMQSSSSKLQLTEFNMPTVWSTRDGFNSRPPFESACA